jgi:hypothetical protein
MRSIFLALFLVVTSFTSVYADVWGELAAVTGKMNNLAMAAINCQSEMETFGRSGSACNAMINAYGAAGAAKDALFTKKKIAAMEAESSIEHQLLLHNYRTTADQAFVEFDKAYEMIEASK